MAGEWIKMRCDLAEDPSVIGISEILKMDADTVVGKLHRFWTWASRQLRSGDAPSVTYSWVDRFLTAPGFAEAMEKVGWLSLKNGSVHIPKFDNHLSQSAKRRALTVKRMRDARSVTK